MEIGPDQGFSLRLFNGSVQFGYDGVSVVSTEEGVVRVDQWYQLYASRLVLLLVQLITLYGLPNVLYIHFAL